MLGIRLNNISADVIFCVWGQYIFWGWRCRAQSDEQPPHYICFNIIICCTCDICPRAVEQATQATTRENLSSGSPTKRISNQTAS